MKDLREEVSTELSTGKAMALEILFAGNAFTIKLGGINLGIYMNDIAFQRGSEGLLINLPIDSTEKALKEGAISRIPLNYLPPRVEMWERGGDNVLDFKKFKAKKSEINIDTNYEYSTRKRRLKDKK